MNGLFPRALDFLTVVPQGETQREKSSPHSYFILSTCRKYSKPGNVFLLYW